MKSSEKLEAIRDLVVEKANAVIAHEYIDSVQKELLDNLNLAPNGLPWYGLGKVAIASAMFGIATGWGINPDILRYSYKSTDAEIDNAYQLLSKLGVVPTLV